MIYFLISFEFRLHELHQKSSLLDTLLCFGFLDCLWDYLTVFINALLIVRAQSKSSVFVLLHPQKTRIMKVKFKILFEE